MSRMHHSNWQILCSSHRCLVGINRWDSSLTVCGNTFLFWLVFAARWWTVTYPRGHLAFALWQLAQTPADPCHPVSVGGHGMLKLDGVTSWNSWVSNLILWFHRTAVQYDNCVFFPPVWPLLLLTYANLHVHARMHARSILSFFLNAPLQGFFRGLKSFLHVSWCASHVHGEAPSALAQHDHLQPWAALTLIHKKKHKSKKNNQGGWESETFSVHHIYMLSPWLTLLWKQGPIVRWEDMCALILCLGTCLCAVAVIFSLARF